MTNLCKNFLWVVALLATGCPTATAPKPPPGSGASPLDVSARFLTPPLVDPYATAWPRHIIHDGLRGADGVDLADLDGDGKMDVAVPWEQAAKVTVSLQPATGVTSQWPTVTLSPISAPEGAIFADVDGDGHMDVITASQSAGVFVSFGPAANYLTASAWTAPLRVYFLAGKHCMQNAFADLDGDGLKDIVMGCDGTSGLGYLKNPGTATARTASAWVLHAIGAAGWPMALFARDVDGDGDLDVVLSDRTGTLGGARWVENQGATWVNHPISIHSGSTGADKFISLADINGDGILDVIEGRGDWTTTQTNKPNRVRTLTNPNADWSGTWTLTELGDEPQVASYQSNAVADIDGDGLLDIVLAYSYTDAGPTGMGESGVIWMQAVAGGGYTRREISGLVPNEKYDNTLLLDVDGDGDLDVIESEQLTPVGGVDTGIGVLWYENPR